MKPTSSPAPDLEQDFRVQMLISLLYQFPYLTPNKTTETGFFTRTGWKLVTVLSTNSKNPSFRIVSSNVRCLWIPPSAPSRSPLWPSLWSLGSAMLSPGHCSCPLLPSAFALPVPSAQNVFPPDIVIIHLLATFKPLLNCHLVREALLDLPTTWFYTTQTSVFPPPLSFPRELGTFQLAICPSLPTGM